MELNKSTNFKANAADLTKIPPNEFEKYFQEWMERDDVARSLQAKLRCDLIMNFNKTNLGKHILSHTMTSSGGSKMRLILSPLVLALNTLVAEFLYAQNCHFTLSVFCTEIPFRNTLPDFESMQRFRFNNEEISEIWHAITGSKANKRDLNKNIIENYETNPDISLLLLIIKCLLKKDPLDQLKRNAEVQTEIQEVAHKSNSARVSDQDRRSISKAASKDDNFHYINKYLLTLSEKVIEMTKEFEQFAKQTRESRSRTVKSSRSRENYALNKSLERITENLKTMAQTKRKNKYLANIIESIDNLTKQFGKCGQNFDNVIKVLGSKEETKLKPTKVKLKEKQTETELQEKSYNDWIHEMRNTENGIKFLNRVDISLRKALTKHQEQLQTETEIKVKHLKSLMRLHYQQKYSKHLLQDPKLKLEETHKCNENIKTKLQQFESKQIELLKKLQESSAELKEVQIQQEDISKHKENELKIPEEQYVTSVENVALKADTEFFSNREFQKDDEPDHDEKEKTSQFAQKDVSKAQEEIMDIAQTLAEQGRSVDRIIYDAKLRIQQLENESHELDKNFQSYLERNKRTQEQDNNNQKITNICSNLKDLYQITSSRLKNERRKPSSLEKEQDEEIDEEFERLKGTLQQIHIPTYDEPKIVKSDSSTSSLEIRNAILEAKLKFFEHENTIRKCREEGEQIRTGNLLQKQLEKCSDTHEFPDHLSYTSISRSSKNFEMETDDIYRLEINAESSLSEINIKDKSLDEEQDIKLSPLTEHTSHKVEEIISTARKELFPKHIENNKEENLKNIALVHDMQNYFRYQEPVTAVVKDPELHSKGKHLHHRPTTNTSTTSKLIKQSMAKMQQLFEQQTLSQETLRGLVNELQQERILQEDEMQNTAKIHLRPNEALEKSLTTTTILTTSVTTNATTASEKTEKKNQPTKLENITIPICNISVPSLLNLYSNSEYSIDSDQYDVEMTPDAVKDIGKQQATTNVAKEQDLTTTKHQQEETQINESFESSELKDLPSPNKKYQGLELNSQQEFGQLNDSPKLSDINLYSPGNDKEIIEIFTSNRTSSQSTSDFEISTGHQNKDSKNLDDGSESDFWA